MYHHFFYYSRVGLDENDISQYYETISIHTESSQTNVTKTKTSDSITRIYACATMWHETQGEMLEMLKSIFRYVFPRILEMYTYDLSFASTETKFIKPKTKTQNNFLVNTGFLVNFFQKKPK